MTNRESPIQIGIGLADIGFGIALVGSAGGAPPGLLLIAVGADQVYTGIANILTGQKNRSLFEEAGYNLTLKLGYSESTAGIVGQLTPGLLSLGAGIWGGLATSAARMNGRIFFAGGLTEENFFKAGRIPIADLSPGIRASNGLYAIGGQPYGSERLATLGRYLSNRGVTLEIQEGMSGGSFTAVVGGNSILRVGPNVTRQVVWHELAHYIHWRRVGGSVNYRALPREFGNHVPEQFVIDMLQQARRWDQLSPHYRLLSTRYIIRQHGGYFRGTFWNEQSERWLMDGHFAGN